MKVQAPVRVTKAQRNNIRLLAIGQSEPTHQSPAENILDREWIDLDQEYRRCWRFVGAGERAATLTVPEGDPQLHFGSGTLAGSRRAWLRVVLEDARGRETELWKQAFGPPGRGWIDRRLELGRWAGEQVALRFTVETEDHGVYLVGSPVVRTAAGRRPPGVLLVLIDTVRADRLSAYGLARRSMPHFDRLAGSLASF